MEHTQTGSDGEVKSPKSHPLQHLLVVFSNKNLREHLGNFVVELCPLFVCPTFSSQKTGHLQVESCQRAYQLLRGKLDFAPSDIIFDCLLTPVGSEVRASVKEPFFRQFSWVMFFLEWKSEA